MNVKNLKALLDTLPDDTEVCIRGGGGGRDEAWMDLRPRLFQEHNTTVLYLQPVGGHRNFPEGYRNVQEIPIPGVRSDG